MDGAPIVVHRPSATGGRRVSVRGQILGLAHSDRDLVVFLEAAGVLDPEQVLDDPLWVEWRGGGAHQWDAAWPGQSSPEV
ncbi:hypothetical protein ACFVT1_36485 [Streptomyces sp. NPDC057963]|uniref:hypothetical protein n=1 Tax=Streptomyces sp. NPDC057963 TaxID=3346290 RepID=UPI0036E53CBD